MNENIEVSKIISKYNDATRLSKALNSINQIFYSHVCLKIIVVDDSSIDDELCSKVVFEGAMKK